MMESLVVTFYTMCWTFVIGSLIFLAVESVKTLFREMR